jgi:ribosomal protein L16 Arg81 hydroxylase
MKLKDILSEEIKDMMQQHAQGNVDDHEVSMAVTDLRAIADMAAKLAKHVENHNELEGWIQSKITKSADYIQAVFKNLMYSDHDCGCGSKALQEKTRKKNCKNK